MAHWHGVPAADLQPAQALLLLPSAACGPAQGASAGHLEAQHALQPHAHLLLVPLPRHALPQPGYQLPGALLLPSAQRAPLLHVVTPWCCLIPRPAVPLQLPQMLQPGLASCMALQLLAGP